MAVLPYLLLLCSLSVVFSSADKDVDESHVVVLSVANFSSAIEAPGKITLVEFYAPWCGHCKTLAPEYAAAAAALSATTPAVVLAKVDATVNEALATQHGISGYPTLKIFRDGKVYDYEGPREAEGIAAQMRAQADPAWQPPKDAVVELTEANFDAVVNAAKLMLVEFYAPWCGHCKSLAPKYERAARRLSARADPIILAKVDATKETGLGQRFALQGYPTLKVFRSGVPQDYTGGRESEEDIYNEMISLSRPAAEQVEDAVAMHMRAKKATALMAIAFLDGAPATDVLLVQQAADQLRKEFEMAYTTHAGARQPYGVPSRTLVLLQPPRYQSPLELPRRTLDLATVKSASEIVQFVRENKYPLVGYRTRTGSSPAANRYDERPLVCVYFDAKYTPEMEAETNHWRSVVLKVASKFKDLVNKDLFFAIADEEEHRSELEDLGLWATDRELEVVIHGKDYRYIMKDDFDGDALADFVQDFLDGKLKPFIKSQKAPKKLDGGVTVVVGSTFNKVVMDPTKDVLIELYAPWCGHCKSLAPVYSQLAKKVKGNKNLIVAKIDATANDVPPAFRPDGYPTIYLVKRGAKDAPIKYEGARDVNGFVEFLEEHTEAGAAKDEL